MIVFDLDCLSGGHRFEGWFKSSDDFARQHAGGLVDCPTCGSTDVVKAAQAARLARKGNQLPALQPARAKPGRPADDRPVARPSDGVSPARPVASVPLPPQLVEAVQKLAHAQAEALKSSRWVGERFAENARAMHYGEREAEVIHGQATLAQAEELAEEGIAVMPLPFPVAPPEQAN